MPVRITFRPRQRLTHARQFEAVYAARVSRASGPLVVHAAPNVLGFCRLGLSVGKRAGGAVQRNALKRRIREAFRLVQHELPQGEGEGLDLVVAVRAREPRGAAEYQKRLLELADKLAADWKQKEGEK